MRISATLCTVALALSAVSAAEKDTSDVVTLTTSSFKDFVKGDQLSLVEFYAPWCGHCQALAPHYEEAATTLLSDGVRLAKVDCTVEEALCSEHEVTGFPTLKVFRDGQATPYTGPRKTDGIVSYMRKQQLPAVSEVTPETLDTFCQQDKFVLVAYLDEADQASHDALKSFAEAHRDSLIVGVAHNAAMATAQDVRTPSVIAYRTFDEPKVSHTPKGAALTVDELESFVKIESLPLIDEVSAENFMQYVSTGLPLAYYFVDPASPTREAEVAKLAEVAKEFRGKLNLVWIDAIKFGQHAKALNLPGDAWPALAVQNLETGAKYPHANLGKDVASSTRAFLTKVLSGKVQPSIKSAPVPTQSSPLIDVVADEFDKWVLDDSKDVLLELFAPWCGHCKRLAPTYEKLAEAFANDKHVRIAKMDGTENDIPPSADITLTGFPTIVLKPAGKKSREFIVYEGDRTLESLAEFIESKGTHKASVKLTKDESAAAAGEHDEL